jgi:uncharacterized membrane protein YbaN (DUF454 family)
VTPRWSWKRWPRALRLAVGWLLVVLGVVLLPLPFFQSFLCVAVGLAMLSHDIPWLHRKREALRPHARRWRERWRRWRGRPPAP